MKNHIGTLDPFTVTISIHLIKLWNLGVQRSYNYPDTSKGIPYCLVAASKRAAMLTFGLKYEASILKWLPIDPSIAQPTWIPNPISTLNPGMTLRIL